MFGYISFISSQRISVFFLYLHIPSAYFIISFIMIVFDVWVLRVRTNRTWQVKENKIVFLRSFYTKTYLFNFFRVLEFFFFSRLSDFHAAIVCVCILYNNPQNKEQKFIYQTKQKYCYPFNVHDYSVNIFLNYS